MNNLSASKTISGITVNYSYWDNGLAAAERKITVSASKQDGDVTESINRQYALNGTCTPTASVTATYKKFIPRVELNSLGLRCMGIRTENGSTGAASAQIRAIEFYNMSSHLRTDNLLSPITVTIGGTVTIDYITPPDNANRAELVPVPNQAGVLPEQFPISIIPTINDPI